MQIFNSEQYVSADLFDEIVNEVKFAGAHGVNPTRIEQVCFNFSTVFLVIPSLSLTLFTGIIWLVLLPRSLWQDRRRLQAQKRRALRQSQPEMGQMVPAKVSPVLFWPKLVRLFTLI